MTNRVRFSADIDDKVSGKLDRMRDKFDSVIESKGAKSVLFGVGVGVGAAAFSAAADMLVSNLGAMAEAFREDEASQARFRAALEANVPAFTGNTRAIEDVIAARGKLGFSDDEQRSSLATLVTRTKDATKALELQRTAMDLARLRGMDLAAATDLIGKAYAGQVGALRRAGIAVDANATATEALAAVQRAAAGQAEAFAETSEGRLAAAQVAAGEASEKFGKVIDRLSQAVLPAAVGALEGVAGAFDLVTARADAPADAIIAAAERGSRQAGHEWARLAEEAGLSMADYKDRVASAAREAAFAIRDDIGIATDAVATIGVVADETADEFRTSMQNVTVSFAKTRDELRAIADDAVSSVYTPMRDALRLTALDAEIAAQQRVVADKTATAEEKANAQARLLSLQEERESLQLTMVLHGELDGSVTKFTKTWTKRWQEAADDIQPAIGRILAQLAQLREQTDRPFNARVSVTAHGLVGGDDDRRRAHGGPVWPGVWTVGENGPETLVVGPGMSGHVYADGGRAGGAAVTIGPGAIVVNGVSDPEEIARRIVQPLRRELKRQGMSLA